MRTPGSTETAVEGDVAAEQPIPEWPFEEADTVDANAFYRDISRTGINYGKHFRMVQRASVDGSTAVMRYSIPALQIL